MQRKGWVEHNGDLSVVVGSVCFEVLAKPTTTADMEAQSGRSRLSVHSDIEQMKRAVTAARAVTIDRQMVAASSSCGRG